MKLSALWQMITTVIVIGGGVTVYNDFQTEKSNYETRRELIHYSDSISQRNAGKNLTLLAEIIDEKMVNSGVVDYDLIFSASEQTAKKYYNKNQRSNKALFEVLNRGNRELIDSLVTARSEVEHKTFYGELIRIWINNKWVTFKWSFNPKTDRWDLKELRKAY